MINSWQTADSKALHQALQMQILQERVILSKIKSRKKRNFNEEESSANHSRLITIENDEKDLNIS